MIKVFGLCGPKKRRVFVAPAGGDGGGSFRGPKKNGGNSVAYVNACRIRSSARWRNLRDVVLSRYPLCLVCGCVADEVHHIVPVAVCPELAFVVTNLLPICKGCHDQLEAAEKRGITIDDLVPAEKRVKEW